MHSSAQGIFLTKIKYRPQTPYSLAVSIHQKQEPPPAEYPHIAPNVTISAQAVAGKILNNSDGADFPQTQLPPSPR